MQELHTVGSSQKAVGSMNEAIVSEIPAAGVAAIRTYLECASPGFNEDSVSERSLSAFMALQLCKQTRSQR